jgi:hypothetical protein
VRLESSTPARDALLIAPPPRLELRFSAHIEDRYTQLELTGPDDRRVPLGAVTFVAESDRAFFADVPPLATAPRPPGRSASSRMVASRNPATSSRRSRSRKP